MGWKRDAVETLTGLVSRVAPAALRPPDEPRSIFVLRNNDLGDVLVVTPLFAALRRRFPQARIVAGVGKWAMPILEGNPHLDEVIPVNAPWHNQQMRHQNAAWALGYTVASAEARALCGRHFDIGIDVLGSPFGALLLMRAGIRWRLGVRGYAGGHSAMQQCVRFDERQHVSRAALGFAELLGATDLPEPRPQLFLSDVAHPFSGHVVFAPGGGYAEKCWPRSHFLDLAKRITQPIVVIGGPQDREAGAQLAQVGPHVIDRTGALSLRESFAAIADARLVVCNSSMAMHAAAAFRRPSVVVLGSQFSDAAQHAVQWGYRESRVLGRDAAHANPWSPDEVWPIVQRLLAAE